MDSNSFPTFGFVDQRTQDEEDFLRALLLGSSLQEAGMPGDVDLVEFHAFCRQSVKTAGQKGCILQFFRYLK